MFAPGARKFANDALKDITSLQKGVAVSVKCKVEPLTDASAASGQTARATTELRQVRDTLSTQSKELARVTLSRMSIKKREKSFAF